MQRAKEASAAAVIEAVSSIAADVASIELGSPEDPGLTFDQLFDWHEGHTGVPYWDRGSRTFERYLQTAFWDQTESGTSTGYRDPGWSRTVDPPEPEELLEAKGRMHCYADHNRLVSSNCELIGIGVGELRRHLGLDVRRRPHPKNSDEHARSRTISGCLRHSASLIPDPGRPLNMHNGIDCAMDTGGRFLVFGQESQGFSAFEQWWDTPRSAFLRMIGYRSPPRMCPTTRLHVLHTTRIKPLWLWSGCSGPRRREIIPMAACRGGAHERPFSWRR